MREKRIAELYLRAWTEPEAQAALWGMAHGPDRPSTPAVETERPPKRGYRIATLHVRMLPETMAALRCLAQREGRTMTRVVETLIHDAAQDKAA